MKNKKLFEQIRQSAAHHRKIDAGQAVIIGHRTSRKWPLCLTCGKEVDAVEMRDVSNNGAELWAQCHGKEDFYKVRFPFRIDGDVMEDERANWYVQRAMHDFCPFNPTDVPR
jgi:hypothetical protein